MQKQFRLLEAAALIAMGICVLLSVLSFAETGSEIQSAVLRLHVIANSDSEADQALKLQVRDALLSESEALAAADSKQQAEQTLQTQLEAFRRTAKQVVTKQGYDYDVAVSLERAAFPTRTYGDVTLPAGTYDALRVVIGEGKGKNWWCVMFPPLCLPAATDGTKLEDILDEDALRLIHEEPSYELRFWIVEQWEKWKAAHGRRVGSD